MQEIEKNIRENDYDNFKKNGSKYIISNATHYLKLCINSDDFINQFNNRFAEIIKNSNNKYIKEFIYKCYNYYSIIL